jgi:hypothetical protein
VSCGRNLVAVLRHRCQTERLAACLVRRLRKRLEHQIPDLVLNGCDTGDRHRHADLDQRGVRSKLLMTQHRISRTLGGVAVGQYRPMGAGGRHSQGRNRQQEGAASQNRGQTAGA